MKGLQYVGKGKGATLGALLKALRVAQQPDAVRAVLHRSLELNVPESARTNLIVIGFELDAEAGQRVVDAVECAVSAEDTTGMVPRVAKMVGLALLVGFAAAVGFGHFCASAVKP